MGKNILIFSDGTGQGGGVSVDEQRSNVYKLFRATRFGTDSCIPPSKQIAFYDAGLGSPKDGAHIKIKKFRGIYNLISQVSGLGITRNMIDCYAYILQVWQPGDRIYLYGFSRGAYTARCVSGVLECCGVPVEEDGSPIKRDSGTAHRIAREAVKKVYQHGVGRRASRYKKQRMELAQQFRKKYGCDVDGESNAVPYFIGVWDTVAALGVSGFKIFLAIIAFFVIFYFLKTNNFLPAYITSILDLKLPVINMSVEKVTIFALAIFSVLARIKFATGLSGPWWKTLHWRAWRMKFYDTHLNPRVEYAKHALSIDENRKDFKRVAWTFHDQHLSKKEDQWFEQVWFSGVHSDVGGSYLETESRLSDIALKWMVEKSQAVSEPVLIDEKYLNLYPDAEGIQHDEYKRSSVPFKKGLREIPNNAPLHPSVIERFKSYAVTHYDEVKPYRPIPLRHHKDVQEFYE